jgi:hypothetical protein
MIGKVTPLQNAIESLNRVQEKKDSDQGNSRQQPKNPYQDRRQKNPKHNDIDPDSKEFQKEIEAAVGKFRAEQLSKATGIHADQIGEGPGLKVVLKDGSGAVIRQFTGEEFLRMREETQSDGRVRGKILDQKL